MAQIVVERSLSAAIRLGLEIVPEPHLRTDLTAAPHHHEQFHTHTARFISLATNMVTNTVNVMNLIALSFYRRTALADTSANGGPQIENHKSSVRANPVQLATPGINRLGIKEEEDDNDDDRRHRHPDGGHSSETHSLSGPDRALACPFAKYAPSLYNWSSEVEAYRSCAMAGLGKDISRVKQHLYRVHARPHHQYQPESSDQRYAGHMNDQQYAEIQHFRATVKTKEEKWYHIYRTLFPTAAVPSSPYVEDVDDPGGSPKNSMDVFWRFLRDETPQLVAARIQCSNHLEYPQGLASSVGSSDIADPKRPVAPGVQRISQSPTDHRFLPDLENIIRSELPAIRPFSDRLAFPAADVLSRDILLNSLCTTAVVLGRSVTTTMGRKHQLHLLATDGSNMEEETTPTSICTAISKQAIHPPSIKKDSSKLIRKITTLVLHSWAIEIMLSTAANGQQNRANTGYQATSGPADGQSTTGSRMNSTGLSLKRRSSDWSDKDNDEGSKKRRQPPKKRTPSLRRNEDSFLKCPYAVMYPERFSEQNTVELNYRGCASRTLRSISRLKQHLQRVHWMPEYYCRACYAVFKSELELVSHSKERPACIPSVPLYTERMTDTQRKAIHRRDLEGITVEEQYNNICRILFPEITQTKPSCSQDRLELFLNFIETRMPTMIGNSLARNGIGSDTTDFHDTVIGICRQVISQVTRKFVETAEVDPCFAKRLTSALVTSTETLEDIGPDDQVRRDQPLTEMAFPTTIPLNSSKQLTELEKSTPNDGPAGSPAYPQNFLFAANPTDYMTNRFDLAFSQPSLNNPVSLGSTPRSQAIFFSPVDHEKGATCGIGPCHDADVDTLDSGFLRNPVFDDLDWDRFMTDTAQALNRSRKPSGFGPKIPLSCLEKRIC